METKRRRLLLADDSLTIRKVVTLTFSDEGMEVVSVGSGDEAIRHLEESGAPDIVLADVHMPGLSGYEVCERIKQDARWRHLPVVLLAGAFEPFNVAEARRVGADEVLSKPFQSIKELIGKVGSLLGGKGEEPAASHEEPRRDEEARRAGDAQPSFARPAAPADAPAAQASPSSHGATPEAVSSFRRPDSFADLGDDDEMIETMPAEQFGAHAEAARPQASAHAEETADEPFAFAGGETAAHVSEETGARAGEFVASGERDSGAGEFAGAGDFYGAKAAADSWMSERHEAPAYAGAVMESGAETRAPRAAFAARAAGASAADDALLEIGSADVPSAAEVDDFVLDLDFDEPAPSRPAQTAAADDWESPVARPQSARPSEPDAAGAFAEAAHGVAEAQETAAAPQAYDFAPAETAAHEAPEASRAQAPAAREEPAVFEESSATREDAAGVQAGPAAAHGVSADTRGGSSAEWGESPARRGFVEPQVMPSEEPVSMGEDLSVEGDIARPPAHGPAGDSADALNAPHAAAPSPSVSPEQLSPEVIDRIARRVAELMSERAVQEVAWEVVPALAERLIRQRLDEQK